MANPVFRPAHTFAEMYGAKCLVFGPPGVGKTPIINTAPRPILCVSEPGMLSMRGSQVQCCEGFTVSQIADFYQWLFNSAEAKGYDTVCCDSISQQAEIILTDELKKNKDGRKAYGEMSRKMMEYLNGLFYTRYKHTYLICKQIVDDENGTKVKKPFFPGQDLGVKVPHLYDVILHLGIQQIPGVGATKAFRCHESFDVRARDRSGRLGEFEYPDLSAIFNKCIGN